jgi:hypothetical protein
LAFYGELQPLATEKAFAAFLRTLFREDWVVYAKAPFGGPEHVLQYLARYTHRVAISNRRPLSVDDRVTFRWKDYAHHNKSRVMTLRLEEFLRRFLQHALPKELPSIRYVVATLPNLARGRTLACRCTHQSKHYLAVSSLRWRNACCWAVIRQADPAEQFHRVCILDSS